MTLPISRLNTDEAREDAIDHNLNAATDSFGVTDADKAYAARNQVYDQNVKNEGVKDQASVVSASDAQRRRGVAKLTQARPDVVQPEANRETFSPSELSGKITA